MKARWIGPAAVLLLLLPVAWVLGSRVEDTYEEPLTREHRDRLAVPIELSYADYPLADGTHTARTILYLDDLDTLLRRDAIEIRVATFGTTPRLDAAEIAIPGTPCVYATTPGAEYRNNAILLFERGAGCAAARDGSDAGQLHLTVRYRDAARVGVWTYRHEGTPRDAHTIYVRDPAWSEIGLVVELRGRWIERRGPSDYTRADLLGIMWEVAPGSGWIWGVMAVAAVLLLAGVAGLQSPAAGAALGAASAFLLAMGLTLLYVVLVPPFQAPDEPSHFGGYAFLTGQPEVHDAANLWGYRMHFMRIHSNPRERFRPADVGQPFLASWDVSPLGADRSSVTVQIWRAAGRSLHTLDVQGQLLALRILNAAIFSLAVALGVFAVWRLAPVTRASALVAVLVLVPTLPFFAMHVSNYAQAIAAYVVVACCMLVIVLGGPRAHWAGLPLGAALAFAILCTRSAVPMLLPAALLGLSRLAAAGVGRRQAITRAAAFWSGVPIAAVLVGLGVTTDYASRLVGEAMQVSSWAAGFVAAGLAHPMLVGIAAWILVTVLEATVVSRRSPTRGLGHRWVRPLAAVGGVLVAANLLVSLFVDLPQLTTAPRSGEGDLAYVGRAIATLTTPFRLAGHDFQAATTFWGGFGWVNTLLPPWMVSLLVGGTALALIGALWRPAREGDGGRFSRTVLFGFSVILTLGAYAAAGLWTPVVLHGRYLVGLYLAALVVAWSPALGVESDRGGAVARTAWWLAGLGHATALVTILTRYF